MNLEDKQNSVDGPKPKLLIVEDDPTVRRMLVRSFRDNYTIREAHNGADGLSVALSFRPDVIITDQRMPEMTGIDFLTQVRKELPRTIRVLVTGYTDYGPLVDALNIAHVHHYFEKPFHTVDVRTVVDVLHRSADLERQRDVLLERLREAVGAPDEVADGALELTGTADEASRRSRQLERANEALHDANQRLRELAVRDSLTGLFNHRYLMEHVELEVARARRYGRVFSLLFVDLDDFKQINDEYGHSAGDAVLARVAQVMQGAGGKGMRSSDLVARYGGEEFCVVLPETPFQGALIKAERLREEVAETDWSAVVPHIARPVTVSVGIATFPEDADTASALLDVADGALYRAKGQGKNQVVGARKRASAT